MSRKILDLVQRRHYDMVASREGIGLCDIYIQKSSRCNCRFSGEKVWTLEEFHTRGFDILILFFWVK